MSDASSHSGPLAVAGMQACGLLLAIAKNWAKYRTLLSFWYTIGAR